MNNHERNPFTHRPAAEALALSGVAQIIVAFAVFCFAFAIVLGIVP